MKLTRVEAQRILDKIDTLSDFPWKHELSYLRETIDELFDQQEKLTDEIERLNDQICEMSESCHTCPACEALE